MTLRRGSQGAEVKRLQKLLGIAQDGIFGAYTEKAIRELQLKHGLSADGVVGAKTWALLLGNDSADAELTGAKGGRNIKRIFVHATAGDQRTTTVDTLKAEFKNKGWKNPGYHYVVFPDGKVVQMLSEGLIANGVSGYNSTSVHVSWVGGYNGVDNRTDAQKETLIKVLRELHKKYPTAEILGHRDIWGEPSKWKKVCPCFNAKIEYREL